MYSHEIKELLKLRNNLINIKEYYKILESPQVNHVKYENNEFNCWTTDNYYFRFKIKKNSDFTKIKKI